MIINGKNLGVIGVQIENIRYIISLIIIIGETLLLIMKKLNLLY